MRSNGRRSRQSQDSHWKVNLRFVRHECIEILIVVVYLFYRFVISFTTARLITFFQKVLHIFASNSYKFYGHKNWQWRRSFAFERIAYL